MIGNPGSQNIESDIPKISKTDSPALIAFKEKIAIGQAKTDNFRKTIHTMDAELGEIDWVYPVNDEMPFNASMFANTIRNHISDNLMCVITDKNSQNIYLYNQASGIYHKDGELFLRILIDKVLGLESKTVRANETIELLKTRSYATMTYSQKVAVENGLLDVEKGTLEEFTYSEFVTTKLQATYNPEAKSEPWENFINQVCPNDKELLQEWSGYLLIQGYPFHSIMWLYGPTGRNGKGVWARTMQEILGEENYSSVSIDEFDGKHRFAVYNLHDSRFNICSEPRTDRNLTIEMLQMLTGQDAIDAEKKGVQERFKFKNSAKMTVMGNKFPNVDKPTDAFWERLRLCKFPNTFTGKEQVQDIEKTWLDNSDQRSGVLNWMIAGAKRLLSNHGFTMTKTQEETIIQFKRASDSVGAFVAECIIFEVEAFTPKITINEGYKNYCEAIGVPPETVNKLTERFKDTPKIKDTSKRILNVKTKVWGGIKLGVIPSLEESEETEELTTQKTLDNSVIGTTGTAFPCSILTCLSKDNNIIFNSIEKVVPMVPVVPGEIKECGKCGVWRTGSCQYPGDPNSVVGDSQWAAMCHGWTLEKPKLRVEPLEPDFSDKEKLEE